MPHPQAFRQVAGLDQSLLLRIGDETVAGTEGPPVMSALSGHGDRHLLASVTLSLEDLPSVSLTPRLGKHW